MVNYTSNQSQLVVESILNEKNRQFLENFCRVSTTKLTEDRNKLLGEENPPVAEEFSSDPNTENDRRKLSTDYQLRKASRKLTRSSKIALDLLETPCGDKSNSFESEGVSYF